MKEIIAPGVKAMRESWRPILVIWMCAALVVFLNGRWAPVTHFAEWSAVQKANGGLLFVIVAGAISCGAFPEVAKWISGKLEMNREWLGLTCFTGFVYAIISLQVDIFYRGQAALFGHGSDPMTLFKKTLVDMLVFSVFLSIPTATGLFNMRKESWRPSAFFKAWTPKGFRELVLPGLVPCWIFWTPVLLLTYSLDLKIQWLFANVIEGAWAVLFVYIQLHEKHEEPAAQPS